MKITRGRDLFTACNMICPPGNYCPAGSTKPIKCSAGRFGASEGLMTEKCSGDCSAGYFCPTGSVSPVALPCGNISFYCPAGTPRRLLVEDSFYSATTLPDLTLSPLGSPYYRSSQLPCDPGYYCQHGIKKPCPAGRFGSTFNLNSPNCSDECPIGNYCPEASILPILCPLGTYGSTRSLRLVTAPFFFSLLNFGC